MNQQRTRHVWEKVELTFEAQNACMNPYAEVTFWVDLEGPRFGARCYGFWDGGNTFRVRITAPRAGEWHWASGSEPVDRGLAGHEGSFVAVDWTEEEKRRNPCRRGFVRATENGHAFRYADGTPFFLTADTWWAAGTFRFPWREDEQPRPIGPQMAFQDAVRYRARQGYNSVAIIAAFPAWANDGRPATLEDPEGRTVRAAWPHPRTDSAQDMHDEDGNRPFEFPGTVPGFEEVFPDVNRPNPAYFRSLDRKIDYLNSQGFVPFVEVARRDVGHMWKTHYPWPDSYVRYVQYVWSRLQANNCLLSPIHFDYDQRTIPADDWNEAANLVVERYGAPPFNQPRGTNSSGSSLHNWGHVGEAQWLTFHQLGNWREHEHYPLLTEAYRAEPPVPCLNGEPYYDGWGSSAEPGSCQAALYCRSGMYGSVLSGGLGGHIYGAEGLWQGAVEPEAAVKSWEALQWESGAQMKHLREFILSEGARYQELQPRRDEVTPNSTGEPNGYTGWAYCARTEERGLYLLYFERECPRARLLDLPRGARYRTEWFDPRTGAWTAAGPVQPDEHGEADLPAFPGGGEVSGEDWALKLVLVKE